MRHAKKGKPLGSDEKHKKAILRGLSVQLIEHEKIKTTITKANELQPYVEKLITIAKNSDVHSRRVIMSKLGNQKDAVHKLITEIAPKYAERPGGYTRIMKIGERQGDAALIVQIALV